MPAREPPGAPARSILERVPDAPLLFAISSLALALRLLHLGHQSLWMDEVLTATIAARPLRVLLFDPTVDVNFPPLHNVLVHLVRSWLGAGDAYLRLPSALAGALGVPLLFATTHRLAGRDVALFGALLLAVSPFHVWYGQEARPYALLLLLGLLTLWCAVRFLERPDSMLWLSGFVLAATATFYTHVIAGPVLLALGLYLLASVPAAFRWRTVAAGVVLALLLLPQVLRFASAPPSVTANAEYRFEYAHLAYTFWAFATGYSLGPSLLELRGGVRALQPYLWLIVPVAGWVGWVCVLGGRELWRSRRRAFWFVVGWVVVPIGSAVLGSFVTTHPYNVRYAILAAPGFLVLCAAGLTAIRHPGVRAVALAGVLLIAALSLYNYYAVPGYAREDNRGAAQFLSAHAAPGDVVVVSARYTVLPLRYYSTRADVGYLPYPPSGMTDSIAVARDMAAVIGARRCVWLFLSRTFHSDPNDEILDYFEARLRRTHRFIGSGVRVLRFCRGEDRRTGP